MVLDQSLLSLLLSAVLEAMLEARTFMTPWNQCNCMPTMLYKQMPCIFTCKRGQLGRGMHCASLGAMHNACIPAVSIDTVSILDWSPASDKLAMPNLSLCMLRPPFLP